MKGDVSHGVCTNLQTKKYARNLVKRIYRCALLKFKKKKERKWQNEQKRKNKLFG